MGIVEQFITLLKLLQNSVPLKTCIQLVIRPYTLLRDQILVISFWVQGFKKTLYPLIILIN